MISAYYFITATVAIPDTDVRDETHFVIGTKAEGVGGTFLRDEALASLEQLEKTGSDRLVTFGEPLKMPPDIRPPEFPPIRDAADTKTWVVTGLHEANIP